jgi:hypothetical protein
LDSSLTIIFALLHDTRVRKMCLGNVDVRVERLLEFQHLQPNEGEYRLTVDRDATIDH